MAARQPICYTHAESNGLEGGEGHGVPMGWFGVREGRGRRGGHARKVDWGEGERRQLRGTEMWAGPSAGRDSLIHSSCLITYPGSREAGWGEGEREGERGRKEAVGGGKGGRQRDHLIPSDKQLLKNTFLASRATKKKLLKKRKEKVPATCGSERTPPPYPHQTRSLQ